MRAGYIRRQAPGIFAWLPLGLKVRRKIENIIREELEAFGAQEVHFPALLPREPYETTGRWTEYGEGIFRLKDRKGADYLLAPTHEEVFTLLVKDLYSSYKDLPLSIYQIQDKYRDEARPRAGLLRGREFSMKDSYSFDSTDAGLDVSYQQHRDAYERIFQRLGLDYVIVQADAGAMGGSRSEEFLHPTPIGEDTFVRSAGGYAANVEAFTTPAPPARSFEALDAAVVLDTPDTPTISTLVALANQQHPRPDGRAWTACGHAQERRARPHRSRRHPRARGRGAARGPRRRPQARGGGLRSCRGGGRERGRLREAPGARQGLHRALVRGGAGARRAVDNRHPIPPGPARVGRQQLGHGRQRERPPRLRPRRRSRFRRRRHRAGRRGARRRSRARRLRAGRAHERHGDRARLPARAQVRAKRSASRCSTRTASS